MKTVNRHFLSVILLLVFMVSMICCHASAEVIQYGESWQVNPQKTSIQGSGKKDSGYASLPNNYFGYSFGGGARGEWLQNTGEFTGSLSIRLYKKSSPANPIAKCEESISYSEKAKGFSSPKNTKYYTAVYDTPNLDIASSQKYMYTAQSINIPSTVKIHYLFFLYFLA